MSEQPVKRKILIVEDSKAARALIRSEFHGQNYEIIEASTGNEALTLLASEAFDLVTVDLGLPDISGFDVCGQVMAARQAGEKYELNTRAHFIFLTGSDDVDCRMQGFRVGATDFLGKNFVHGQLLAAAERILKDAHRFEGLKALLVDDSKAVLRALQSCLAPQGFQLTFASSGEEAFEILKNQGSQFDLMITDHFMPGMDGVQLCQKARMELGLRDMTIVFLSAAAETDSSMGLEFFQAGATDYLAKPFIKELLLARIHGHMDSRLLLKRLARYSSELLELNRMKDNFLSICSHDLQAPLGVILGFGSLLSEESEIPETFRNDISIMRDAADHLSNLVHNLLDLSRLQELDQKLPMESVRLSEAANHCVKMLRPLAQRKGVALEVSVTEDVCIWGHQLSLARIISNLISNAVKFTPHGGRVVVAVASTGGDKGELRVTDTGVGMGPDKLAVLFDRFSKASSKGTAGERGTGLGMSITQGLVQAHNGRIKIESEHGKGTNISVELPLVAQGAGF